jgi:hypothetical protein
MVQTAKIEYFANYSKYHIKVFAREIGSQFQNNVDLGLCNWSAHACDLCQLVQASGHP